MRSARGVVGYRGWGGLDRGGESAGGAGAMDSGYWGEKRSNAVGVWGISGVGARSVGDDGWTGVGAVWNVPDVGENCRRVSDPGCGAAMELRGVEGSWSVWNLGVEAVGGDIGGVVGLDSGGGVAWSTCDCVAVSLSSSAAVSARGGSSAAIWGSASAGMYVDDCWAKLLSCT